MTKINKTRQQPLEDTNRQKGAHANFMGGMSYDLTPLVRLQCMAASCFFGEPQYYKRDQTDTSPKRYDRYVDREALTDKDVEHLANMLDEMNPREWRSLTPAQSLERAIDEALEYDAGATLEYAITLREQEHIRATPQVIIVRAANRKDLKGTGLIREYNQRILGRLDEVSTQAAYQLATYGKPIPNSLKRAWADRLKRAKGYELAKYRMEGRDVKTVDAANLAYGKGFYGYQNDLGRLMRGELSLGEDHQTWESIRSSGGTWNDAVEVMGHMALLRNLRNLAENKVDPDRYVQRFLDGASEGKQLPFRYYSAHRQIEGKAPARVLDAVEQAMEQSVGNLPYLPGKSCILTDNSGSAQCTTTSSMGTMRVSTIGNLMGVLTGKASDEAGIGVFGDRLEWVPVQKKRSTFDILKDCEHKAQRIGGGTEHGIWLALDQLIKHNQWVDNLFIYSDMQAGHGGLYGHGVPEKWVWGDKRHYGPDYVDVPKLIREYRNRVNPKVNVFCVQTAGYEDTLIPEFYKRTYILGGWSDKILHFAERMIRIQNQLDGKEQQAA
jgi:hypothetical protein